MTSKTHITNYSPFGAHLQNRNFTGEKYRYGLNGQERDDEVKGSGNSYTTEFRQYDSRLGRWLSLDPLLREFGDINPYNFVRNCPIIYLDPKGDELEGTDRRSARRLKRNMKKETFDGEEYKEFRKLIRRRIFSYSFKKIDQSDFYEATKDLSDDERALAEGYFTMINDNNKHFISIVKKREKVRLKNPDIDNRLENSANRYANGNVIKGSLVDSKSGGGVNFTLGGLNQSLSIVVSNSTANVGDFQNWGTSPGYISRSSSLGELIAHEAIGHGLGRLSGSPTWQHADAVQMTNLFLRVVYSPHGYFRDGTSHGNRTRLNQGTAEGIPPYINNANNLFNLIKSLPLNFLTQ